MTRNILFDHGRAGRIGLPESVFCQGKSTEALCGLLRRFCRGSGHAVLFTRLEEGVFRDLPPDVRGCVDYHPLSRTAIGDAFPPFKGKNRQGSGPPRRP
jgi:NCAIR mutase (PurE)-related protein